MTVCSQRLGSHIDHTSDALVLCVLEVCLDWREREVTMLCKVVAECIIIAKYAFWFRSKHNACLRNMPPGGLFAQSVPTCRMVMPVSLALKLDLFVNVRSKSWRLHRCIRQER